MMRLALAAALLSAVAAAPTCTEESCCVPKVQGMCAGNTHDASGKKATETGYVAAEVDDVVCSGTTPENKGSTATGRDAAACCQAATPAPPPAPAPATCATVTHETCGAGWIKDDTADAASCVGTACDMTVEADKVACCTACTGATYALAAGTTCAAHTTAACPIGKGWAGSNTANDGACTDCPNGKASDDTDASACEDCAAGTIPTITATSATTRVELAATKCDACEAGKFNTVATADCAAHATPSCPAGEGKQAGTTTADAVCVACVAGVTFTAETDDSACGDVSSVTCAPGKGFSAGGDGTTDNDATNSCSECPAGKAGAGGDNAAATCESCPDGKYTADSTPAFTDAAGAVSCEACPTGKFDHDGIPTTDCQAVATGADVVSACPAGEGFVAASTTNDAKCEACVAGVTFTAETDDSACGDVSSVTCAAGKGFSAGGDGTTDNSATNSCSDCPAGKAGEGGVDAAATCVDCEAGKWSAGGVATCTDCASGLSVAAGAGTAATDCTARSEYCLLASADDDTDTDTDGQPFACPAGKYVASDVMTEAVLTVAQCTAVPATGDAITDAVTTCTTVAAEDAVTGVTGVSEGVDIVLDGPDTARAQVIEVDAEDAVAAACNVATGAGSCTMTDPVAGVNSVATTCPEPVVEDKTTAGAATAAPLAVAAVLAAVFA